MSLESSMERGETSGRPRSSSNEPERTTDPVVSVQGLRKEYGKGDDAVEAVTGVDLSIRPGSVVGLLGPNGAGKTTTIKSILGLIYPSEGDIEVSGVNVHEDTSIAHEHMGATLEGARNTYWRLTVRENIEIFSVIGGNDYRKRTEEIESLIEQFGLSEKADTVVRELSRGQKQKVSLACALARDTDVVFLDEPTLGLDVESTRRLQREIRRLAEDDGRTIILSSHDMDVIRTICDRAIIMNDGEIVADDTVENLIGLFDAKTYDVVVDGDLGEAAEQRLASEFFLKNVERRSGTTALEVETDGDEFYRLVDTLEESGLDIESFSEVEMDFDDVFLHLTDQAEEDERRAREVAARE